MLTDRSWVDPGFELVDSRYDVSGTYDGYLVVSSRFRNAASFTGAVFSELPRTAGFFTLASDTIVRFDAERRETRFEDWCATCGRYVAIAGATPAFLVLDGGVPADVCRTDVEFGTGNEQHPLIIVRPEVAERISGLRGVDLDAVRETRPPATS